VLPFHTPLSHPTRSLPLPHQVVLRRALEFIPNSVQLWKTAIELEDVSDARIMLARATECVPHSVEMWLALAKLETHENARKVLNAAREAIPTEPTTWLTAAKLEEAHGNGHLVGRIVEKMLASLAQYQVRCRGFSRAPFLFFFSPSLPHRAPSLHLRGGQVVISRETWLREAEMAEQCGAPMTCQVRFRALLFSRLAHLVPVQAPRQPPPHLFHRISPLARSRQAIVKNTVHIGVEDEDLLATWMGDAEACVSGNNPTGFIAKETARAIYAHALSLFPTKKALWLSAAMLEKEMGTPESLETILKDAVHRCPRAEILWLMAAKVPFYTPLLSPPHNIDLTPPPPHTSSRCDAVVCGGQEKWLAGNVPGARAILVEAFDANPDSEQVRPGPLLLPCFSPSPTPSSFFY